MKKDRKNKKMRVRRVIVPLMGETHNRKALELHAMVETAIEAPSFETMTELAKRLGCITATVFAMSDKALSERRDGDVIAIRTMERTLVAIQDRFDRLGTWATSHEEDISLRQSAGRMDETIGKLPFNVLHNAERLIDMMLKTMNSQQFTEMMEG